jgi:hypothetical protein
MQTKRLSPKNVVARQVNWQWLALLAFVCMEMSWATAWIKTANAAISATPSVQILFLSAGIVLLTTIVSRFSIVFSLNLAVRRLLAAVVLGVGLWVGYIGMETSSAISQTIENTRINSVGDFLGVIPAWFWITIYVILLWLRGSWLARQRIGPMTVYPNFRLGLLMFGLYALAGFLIPLAKETNPTDLLFLFLFFSLLALVTSRVSILAVLRGGAKSPFDSRWMVAVGLTTFGFVVIAYGAAALVTGQAAIFLNLAAGVFVLIGAILAAPILLVLYLISPAVETIGGMLPTPAPTSPFEGMESGEAAPSGGMNFLDWSRETIISPEVQILLVLVGVVAVIIVLIYTVRWVVRQRENDQEDLDQDYLMENKDLLRLLQQMFRNRVTNTADMLTTRRKLSDKEKAQAADRIRVIYSNLLDLAEGLGHPRLPHLTPLEFLDELQFNFPQSKSQLKSITDAYLNVRYGELPETLDDIQRVETAWQQVQYEYSVNTTGLPKQQSSLLFKQ